MMFDPEPHESLRVQAWDPERARGMVARIVAR
jgi:hypothetical protein